MLENNREKVYIAAGIVFLLLILNTLRCMPDAVENIADYPTMSHEEIVKEYRALGAEVKKPLKNFSEFFGVAGRLFALELAIKKYERTHEALDPRYPPMVLRSILLDLNHLRIYNEERNRHYKGSPEEYRQADEARDQTLFRAAINARMDPVSIALFKEALATFHLGFIPLAFLIYMIRIRDQKGSVAFEAMSNPWFPIYLLLWEVGLFKYKATGLRTQIRRMLRYASLTLSAALSFGGGALKAQTQSKDSEPTGGNGHTLVISGSTQYLGKYLGLDGAIFHPEPVLQSSVTIAHESGLYANFWKSIALTNLSPSLNYGREEDYMFGLSRKWGKREVDANLTYFNVTPLNKLPRGDLIQAAVMISNLAPRLPVSTYVWIRTVQPTKDGKPPGGWFVHLGGGKSIKMWRGVQLAMSAEAVSDSGAFGYKPAGIFRGSAALRVPWRKFVFELPSLRVSSPFTRPDDGRKLEQVLGVGLSFSFTH